MKLLPSTVLAIALLEAPALPSSAQSPTLPLDGVLMDSYAAVVNGTVITVSDVFAAAGPDQARLYATLSGPELEAALKENYLAARDRLVNAELVVQDFNALGGTLPDRAVEDHVNGLVHDRFGGDRAALLEALAADRLSYADWTEQIKKQLIFQIMRQREVDSKIAIAPVDVQAEYDAHPDRWADPERLRLDVWSIASPDTSDPGQVAAARALYRAFLRADPASPFPDSSLPDIPPALGLRRESLPDWTPANDLADSFRTALSHIRAPGIPAPRPLGGRTYFLRLLERIPARTRPIEEVSADIERVLRKAEQARLLDVWTRSLRAKYPVHEFDQRLFVDLPDLAAAARSAP